MSNLDVKGFNQFQNEILVIDTNLSDEINQKDEFIAINLPGYKKGQKVPYDHPRLIELRDQYKNFLTN